VGVVMQIEKMVLAGGVSVQNCLSLAMAEGPLCQRDTVLYSSLVLVSFEEVVEELQSDDGHIDDQDTSLACVSTNFLGNGGANKFC
jgi:hypothetical protein